MDNIPMPVLLITVLVAGLSTISFLVVLTLRIMAVYKRDVDNVLDKICNQLEEIQNQLKVSDATKKP